MRRCGSDERLSSNCEQRTVFINADGLARDGDSLWREGEVAVRANIDGHDGPMWLPAEQASALGHRVDYIDH